MQMNEIALGIEQECLTSISTFFNVHIVTLYRSILTVKGAEMVQTLIAAAEAAQFLALIADGEAGDATARTSPPLCKLCGGRPAAVPQRDTLQRRAEEWIHPVRSTPGETVFFPSRDALLLKEEKIKHYIWQGRHGKNSWQAHKLQHSRPSSTMQLAREYKRWLTALPPVLNASCALSGGFSAGVDRNRVNRV